MQKKYSRFKLTRQAAMLGLLSAAYPMAGYSAVAGKADFILGSVEAAEVLLEQVQRCINEMRSNVL